MTRLLWTSLMSEVAEPFCTALANYLTQQVDIHIEFTADVPYANRRQMVMDQEADLAWICGVDYVTNAGNSSWGYEPLVSPCLGDSQEPLYYSDIIVHAESDFHSFEDLHQATWAYNEVESFSGYQIMRGYLADLGEPGPFFGQKMKSGSHLKSIAMVSQGRADSAAIDSAVMLMSQVSEPSLLSNVRIIGRIGPHPMPPLVLSKDCQPGLRKELETTLATMHETPEGADLLHRWQISRFVRVNDTFYDSIRACLCRSKHAVL